MLMNQFLLLGAVLFCIGVYGVLARRNGVMVLMAIELILNSVNINLVAFGHLHGGEEAEGDVLRDHAATSCPSPERRPRGARARER